MSISKGSRRQYSADFKLSLIKQVRAGAKPAHVARNARVPTQTLHNWLHAASGKRHDVNLDIVSASDEIDTLFNYAKEEAEYIERKKLHKLHDRVKEILSRVCRVSDTRDRNEIQPGALHSAAAGCRELWE